MVDYPLLRLDHHKIISRFSFRSRSHFSDPYHSSPLPDFFGFKSLAGQGRGNVESSRKPDSDGRDSYLVLEIMPLGTERIHLYRTSTTVAMALISVNPVGEL